MAYNLEPLGPAAIKEPFMARLNRSNPWGSGHAAGAINALELVQDPTSKDGTLYAASVSGGVWGRQYDGASDTWGPWRWLSHDNGYAGAQSIADIKVLDKRRWLIAAAGAVSSFGNLSGLINNPLQVGERLADGSIRWLTNGDSAQRAIQGVPINVLETSGELVVIGTNQGLYVSTIDEAAGTLTEVRPVVSLNRTPAQKITALAKTTSGRLFAASPHQGIFTASADDLKKNPAEAWHYVPGSNAWVEAKTTVKLATREGPNKGEYILYVGTGGPHAEGYNNYDGFDAIHRLVFSGDSLTPVSQQKADVLGEIGTAQVDSHASFAADPTNAYRVFAGGNWMVSKWVAKTKESNKEGEWEAAMPGASTGGVVGIMFNLPTARFENHFPVNNDKERSNAAGTAPHADSRDIVFLTTRKGTTHLIESDDGGIYSKELAITAPWHDLNDGLRTTEGFASDWSNIGKLAITAMQDNAAALGQYRGKSTAFYNITGGDGAIARFDDGSKGSDGLSRAYYGSQQYSGNGILQTSTHDNTGVLDRIDALSIDIADRYGNFQSFQDYDFLPAGGDSKYPFYHPVATSDYRAGDLVIAGQRNLYEAIIPHWQLPTAGVAKFVPLLEDLAAENFQNNSLLVKRSFTEIALGSQQGSRFSTDKPHSWDALYTSFVTKDNTGTFQKTHFYGRNAQETKGNWFNNLDAYRLKDLTAFLPKIASDNLITGITFNPQNPNQIWLTLCNDSISYALKFYDETPYNRPSYIIHSADGGKNWITVAQSGRNGIPATASLQQIVYAPANGKQRNAELFIGGYGGVWSAPISSLRSPLAFEAARWNGSRPNTNVNLWNTDLEYDPQDDVVVASIMGQGAWLLNRSQKQLTPTKPAAPGLRISQLILPQDINSYRTRKGRSVEGTMEVSLQRDQSNRNQPVSVDLALSPGWQDYIELESNNVPLFNGIDKNNRITLQFPKGVDKLSFYVNTKGYKFNRPERSIALKLQNAKNAPIADGSGSVYLYATGDTPYLLQEAPGVFYSNRDPFETVSEGKPAEYHAQKLSIVMPRANLSQGQKLYWYPVNSEGAVTVSNPGPSNRLIGPKDPGYLEAARQQFNLLTTTTLPQDPRAFNPQKAAQAFSNPQAVLESEGISIGTVATSLTQPKAKLLPQEQGRFAFALSDASGAVRLSPQGFSLDGDPRLDNTAIFGTGRSGNQVVLAPALGELFVVDDIYANKSNPVVDGKLKFNLNIANFGSGRTGYGLFRVDDAYGNFYFVNGKLQGTWNDLKPLEPGQPGYAKEAIRRSFSNSLDGITGLPIPAYGSSAKAPIQLAVGNAYGIYITPNQVLKANSPVPELSALRFSIMGANVKQQLQHVSMGTGYFAFEQSLVGSANNDNDFNDQQFWIEPLGSSVLA